MKILIGKDIGNYSFVASTGVITITGMSTINKEDIYLITNSEDNKIIYNFASSAFGGSIAGNVITLDYDTTTMSDTDSLQILIEIADPTIDFGLGVAKIQEQSPPWARYTDNESLVTTQDLTASYVDFGALIDMRGYNNLIITVTRDINDSENVLLKVLGEIESGGTLNAEIDGISEKTLWTTTALSADGTTIYTFETNGVPYLQLQAMAGTLGATVGDLTINIVKKY